MSIIFSKNNDGVLNVAICGKLTKDPELKESNKGNKIKFSINYAKSKYMDCDAWADSGAGEVAAMLEKGDHVFVMGIHRSWNYNEKTYQSVTVDGIWPMGIMPVAAAPQTSGSAAQPDEMGDKKADGWEELEDEGDLPF